VPIRSLGIEKAFMFHSFIHGLLPSCHVDKCQPACWRIRDLVEQKQIVQMEVSLDQKFQPTSPSKPAVLLIQ
jgi:hypothetical protein